MHRIARSSAHSFDSRLIERFASEAARSSSPTASTAGTRASSLEASFGAYSARPGRERSISAAWDIARHGTAGSRFGGYPRARGAEARPPLSSAGPNRGRQDEEARVRAGRGARARTHGVLVGRRWRNHRRRDRDHRDDREHRGGDCVDLTGEGATFTITISDFAFDPNCFTASASQGISIVNQDDADHTFTITDTQIDVPIAAGETFNGEPIGSGEPGDLRLPVHDPPDDDGAGHGRRVGLLRSRAVGGPSGRAATPSAP